MTTENSYKTRERLKAKTRGGFSITRLRPSAFKDQGEESSDDPSRRHLQQGPG